ncbi:MAG: hypothetical protein HY300_09175 [Verrucomicrobia bacterium]|nr:hypothetical protein [Verrucomicrobiota bacterium]
MNAETEVKLAAWIDGELSAGESREVEALLARDAELSAVAGELRMTKGILAGNEPEVRVPETREFYWSKISREIERLERQPAPAAASLWRSWWLRALVPTCATAAMVALFVLPNRNGSSGVDETESSLQESTVIQFHSASEKMDVIWIQSDVNSNPEIASPDLSGKPDRNENN